MGRSGMSGLAERVRFAGYRSAFIAVLLLFWWCNRLNDDLRWLLCGRKLAVYSYERRQRYDDHRGSWMAETKGRQR